jgi:hypothetical protein
LGARRQRGFIVHGWQIGFTAPLVRAPGSPRHLMHCLAEPDVSCLSFSFGPSPARAGYYDLC